MEQAYFSNIGSRIITYLKNAKSQVSIAMAWFTNNDLFCALMDCLHRNVQVNLVLLDDAINYMYFAPDFNLFIEAGGILRIADNRVKFMHHKFCIIDKKIVITGSYNWTYYAETRNAENIIITDVPAVVRCYTEAFSRLSTSIPVSTSCTRLSLDDIESMDDIDYTDLNYEIEHISISRHEPVRKLFETKANVIVTNVKLTASSKYAIGLLAIDNGHEVFQPIIPQGTELPFLGCEKTYYFDSKHEHEFKCKFIYENSCNQHERGLIKEVDLLPIAEGTSDENLPVKFSMKLENNGSLRIDVSSAIKKLTISALNSNFVKYE